jgi:hypothetical protein
MGTAMAYDHAKSHSPSREEGILPRKAWAVFVMYFPWLTTPARVVTFLEENQGGLEQLVYHESLRQKLDILTSLQVTRAKQYHNDHICDCMISEFYIGKLESR